MIDYTKVPTNTADPYQALMAMIAPKPQTKTATGAAPAGGNTSITKPPVDYTASVMPTTTAPLLGTNVTTGGTTGAAPATGGTNLTTQIPATDVYGTGATSAAGSWQYPQEWQNASGVLNAFAQGMPTAVPNEWNQASQGLNQAATQGATTSTPWYNQAYGNAQTGISDAIKGALEQAGMGYGKRYGSATGRNVADIASRGMGQFQQTYLDRVQQAEEANRANQMNAYGQMYNVGAGKAGLSEAGMNRGMQAAGGLSSLGGQMAQYPMDLAKTAYGIGSGQTAQNNQTANQEYNQWLAQQSYNNPWLQQAMQAGFGYQAPYADQTYQQGAGSQALGAVSSILPWLLML